MSTPEKFTDIHGNSFMVTASDSHRGHVYLEILSNNPGRWIPGEEAPAVALAILEAAGVTPSLTASLDCPEHYERRALAHLETARKLRARKAAEQAEREAEDAKVREFVAAIPGVSYLDESEDHWRHLYSAAQKFFTPTEGTFTVPKYLSDQAFEQMRDLAERVQATTLKPEPRVLQYGDPAPDPGTRWSGRISAELPWYFNDRKRWTRMAEAPGCDWGDIGPVHFPMTEVTG